MNENIAVMPITVFIGVVTFVTSQIILKLMIEPSVQMRFAIGEICNFSLRHQSKITNASLAEGASQESKRLAAQLVASMSSISCYWLARRLFRLPPRKYVIEASQSLNGILAILGHKAADSIDYVSKANEELQRISRCLQIPTNYVG